MHVRGPGGAAGKDEVDVFGIGGEQGLRIPRPEPGEIAAKHGAHYPPVQRGESGGKRSQEDGGPVVATGHAWDLPRAGRGPSAQRPASPKTRESSGVRLGAE